MTTPPPVAYAPTFARESTRSASTRPSAASASSAVLVTSRPCDAASNSSIRSAHHLTGRP